MVSTSNAISQTERPRGTHLPSNLADKEFAIKQILAELQAELELDNTTPNISWIARIVSVLSQFNSR